MSLRLFVVDDRVNAFLGWGMISVIFLVSAQSLVTNAILWGVFSLLVVIVTAVPAFITREWTAMVPWPLLAVVTGAVLARTFGLSPEIAGYLALAGFAIVIVVELVKFTAVELSQWFAIGFGVLTTLALEALWIIAQFYSDAFLDTEFLTTQTALQQDIALVTAIAFAVGITFQWLFGIFDFENTPRRAANDVVSQ